MENLAAIAKGFNDMKQIYDAAGAGGGGGGGRGNGNGVGVRDAFGNGLGQQLQGGNGGMNGGSGNAQVDRILNLLQQNQQFQTDDGGLGGFGGLNGGNGRSNGFGNGRGSAAKGLFNGFGNGMNGYRPMETMDDSKDDETYWNRSRDTDDEQGDDEDDDDDDFVEMKTLLGKAGLSKYTMDFMSNEIKTKEQLMNVPAEIVSFIIPNVKDQERFLDFVGKRQGSGRKQ